MDKTKREELEKAYRKEKDFRVLRNVVITYYQTMGFKLDIVQI